VQSWFRVAGIACIAMGAVGFFIPAIVHVEDRK
jgi:preprotein translocase subunit Sss1